MMLLFQEDNRQMYDIRSIFRRRSAKDLARPKGLPEREINEIMGRDIIPNRLQDTMLGLTNRFDFDDSTRRSPGVIKFNTIDSPVDMDGQGTTDVIDTLNRPVDSYYKLVREHSTRRDDYDHNFVTPLRLIVGIANANDQRSSRPQAEALAVIDMDHRDKSNIEILSIDTHTLGLISPNSFEEKKAALKVIGGWLKRIDKGELLNPHDCRAELKQAAGLNDHSYNKGVMKQAIEQLWKQQEPRAKAHQSTSMNQRLKHIYAAMRKRKPGGPA